VPTVVGLGGGGGPNAGNGSEFTISEVVMYAPMIQLNFKSTDLPATTNSTTVASSSSTSSGTSTTSLAAATSHSTSHGLSSGVKAGIGVGVTFGALAVIGLLAWFILWHRRATLAARQQRPAVGPELHGREKYELPTKEQPTELGAGGMAGASVELHQMPVDTGAQRSFHVNA
jgi:hypothetical protein